jgi:hypothetical protein
MSLNFFRQRTIDQRLAFLAKEQEKSKAALERETMLRHRLDVLEQTFCKDGLPEIATLMARRLLQAGLETDTSRKYSWEDPVRSDPAHHSAFVLPCTFLSHITVGKLYIHRFRDGKAEHRNTEGAWKIVVQLPTDSAGLPMGLPVAIENTHNNAGCGYIWRGSEDNHKIADGIIAMFVGEQPRGDYSPIGRFSCFIASSVYGASAPEVEVLREFRDRVLTKCLLGRGLIRVYRHLAPRVVPYTDSSSGLRLIFRTILSPLVWCIQWLLDIDTPTGGNEEEKERLGSPK